MMPAGIAARRLPTGTPFKSADKPFMAVVAMFTMGITWSGIRC